MKIRVLSSFSEKLNKVLNELDPADQIYPDTSFALSVKFKFNGVTPIYVCIPSNSLSLS